MSKAIYLAGPMTGHPRWNFDAFDDAAKALRAHGVSVISPAEMDLAEGFDPDAPAEEYTLEDRFRAMRKDLQVILNHVHAVVALPGWETSNGATTEIMVARAIGLRVHTLDDVLAVLDRLEGNK